MNIKAIILTVLAIFVTRAEASVLAPQLVSVQPNSAGKTALTVRWTNNNTQRVNFYIERSLSETTGFSHIGIRGNDDRWMDDFGVKVNTQYFYRIRALDTKTNVFSTYSNVVSGKLGGVSPSPTPSASPSPKPTPSPSASPTPPPPSKACIDYPHLRIVPVATALALKEALAGAQEGDLIQLADGTYIGNFVTTVSGSSPFPITLCGGPNTILESTGPSRGYVLHLNGASFWNIIGITARNGQKGIMLDSASYCLLDKVQVYNMGDEAVHFRKNSAHNTIQNSNIHHTGLRVQGYGEGIYIGSSKSNLVGDKSDYNHVLNNHIGPNVSAEGLDIKEYSTRGVVEGNYFDGTGQSGENYADSLIDVKGSNYVIRGNHGIKPLKNGFEIHVLVDGGPSGYNNLFENNVIDVQGTGLGFNVQKSAVGNIIKCNNVVTNAGNFGNVPCSP